jgi:hypothetical protein
MLCSFSAKWSCDGLCHPMCLVLQKLERRGFDKRVKRQAEEEKKNSVLFSLVKEKVGGELI